MVINFARSRTLSQVSIDFSCIVSEIQNTGHSRLLAHGKSYEHGFTKNATVIKFAQRVEFRSVFRAPSRKFKILGFPVLLAHGKSYKLAFAKKYDGHKLCAKSRTESSFDQFFIHHLRNLKYWPIPMY
ncbi:hypothetical protein GW17_00062401 [Ensete ventricosum]|nr:hypothetical protein GW17_00062401 [Ensete ventricosum]